MVLEHRLGLKDDESLQAVSRASAVTLVVRALGVTALLAAPFFFLLPLLRLELLGWILMGLCWALGLFLGARGLVRWRGTLLAVTERRVIAVRRHGFLDRHVIELPLSRIQEVSYRVSGLGPTIFGYGTLLIETSGSDQPLTMERIPSPARLQDVITGLQAEGEGSRTDFGAMLQAVSDLDARQLGLLKSEVDRALRMLPPDPRA